MDIWIGGVVDPLADAAFRGARTPLAKALTEVLGSDTFGGNVDLWSVTPMLISESLLFEEETKYRKGRREVESKQFLSPVEFLAATTEVRIRLIAGTVRRSVQLAQAAGLIDFDAESMLAAIDRAARIAIARAIEEGHAST